MTEMTTLVEAINETAEAVARAMASIGFLESEAARAAELIRCFDLEALPGSLLADVIERDGTRYRLFVAFDDDGARRILDCARAAGASVSTSCTLLDATTSAWARLWGELGTVRGPESEAM